MPAAQQACSSAAPPLEAAYSVGELAQLPVALLGVLVVLLAQRGETLRGIGLGLPARHRGVALLDQVADEVPSERSKNDNSDDLDAVVSDRLEDRGVERHISRARRALTA